SPGTSTVRRTGGLAVLEGPPQAARASGQAAAINRPRRRTSGRVWQPPAVRAGPPHARSRAALYLAARRAVMGPLATERGLGTMLRVRFGLVFGVVALCALPASSSAHTVTNGESLSSVAAANGLTADELAAENGLSPDALLLEGESLYVPD